MSTFSYSATGLPAGLSLDPLTGAVTGTPSQAGVSACTITVTDNVTGATTTLAWNADVLDNPIVLSGTCGNGTIGANYYAALSVTGYVDGAAHTSVSSGTLPPGLTLDTDGLGTVAGQATAYGTYNFSLIVTDSSTPPRSSAPLSQTVVIADNPMTLTGTLGNGTAGVAYSSTLTLSGYWVPPVTIDASAGVIPSWMSTSVSGATVTFSGTPPTGGTFTFTPRATDSSATSRVAVGPAQSVVVAAPLISWASSPTPFTNTNSHPIPAINGSTIAVVVHGHGESAITSNGGASWTTAAQPTNTLLTAMAYGNGVFVAVASGTASYVTSTDGATWTARTLPYDNGAWTLAFVNGLFLLASQYQYSSGNMDTHLYTSPDGITWTSRTLPSGCGNIYGIAYGNGKFLVAGNGTVSTSPDGATWTKTLSTGGGYSTAFFNGLFVSVVTATSIATSSDGVTWTSPTIPAPPSGDSWSTALATSNVVIVLSKQSTGYIASTDGINWSSYTLPTVSGMWNVASSSNTICLGSTTVLIGTT